MRYTIWGPVIGLALGSLLFTFGAFGISAKLFLGTTGVMIVIGLAVGWLADSRIK
ncbi:MAG: hypothetical protein WC624_04290 [Candidatus Margulisiibacteriota bacterium]